MLHYGYYTVFITIVAQQVPLLEQELLSRPELMS